MEYGAWHRSRKVNPGEVALLLAAGVAAGETRVNLECGTHLPKGWRRGIIGDRQAKWEGVAEDCAPSRSNVLTQSGEAKSAWAAKPDENFKEGFAERKFNAEVQLARVESERLTAAKREAPRTANHNRKAKI